MAYRRTNIGDTGQTLVNNLDNNFAELYNGVDEAKNAANIAQHTAESKENPLAAGANITIDRTDPENPIISATGGDGVGGDVWLPDVDADSNLTWTKNSTDTPPTARNIRGLPGQDGLPGERGLQGIQGERGETGETGQQGEQGIQGLQGVPGEPGERGEQGEQGIQGEQGLPGIPGERGEQGIQGIQGETGERGERGEKGDPGDPLAFETALSTHNTAPTAHDSRFAEKLGRIETAANSTLFAGKTLTEVLAMATDSGLRVQYGRSQRGTYHGSGAITALTPGMRVMAVIISRGSSPEGGQCSLSMNEELGTGIPDHYRFRDTTARVVARGGQGTASEYSFFDGRFVFYASSNYNALGMWFDWVAIGVPI